MPKASKKSTKQLEVKAPLTREESIQAALDRLLNTGLLGDRLPVPVVKRRELAVGDQVHYGALANCTVAALFHEGSIVVLEYTVKHKGPLPLEVDKLGYIATPWHEVIKKESERKSEQAPLASESHLFSSFHNTMLSSVIGRHLRGLNDNPDYQRDYVWTDADKERFLDSLFAGHDIGRFIFVKNPYPIAEELLDGKQRLRTLVDFYCGRISHRGFYWDELSPLTRHEIEHRAVQVATLNSGQFTRAELLEAFLLVNAAGVPQTEVHLQKVRTLLEAERACGSA